MTTAARPTFEPAKGGKGKNEGDLSALSKQYSSRDLPSPTKLKNKQEVQGTSEELRRDIDDGEKNVGEKRDRNRESGSSSSSSSSKKQRLEQIPASNLDTDDPIDEDLHREILDTPDDHDAHPLSNGRLDKGFMETDVIVSLLTTYTYEQSLSSIPDGIKNDVFFVIKNNDNVTSRGKGARTRFFDDCGVWDSARGSTPKTFFIGNHEDGTLKITHKKGEQFCYAKKVKGKKTFIRLEPQPSLESIIELVRTYSTLKKNSSYKRRVSRLGIGAKNSIAVVEYFGKFPGLVPHGNSKVNREYIRTPATVMSEKSDLLERENPLNVCNKLTLKNDELHGPKNRKQALDRHLRIDSQEGINACSSDCTSIKDVKKKWPDLQSYNRRKEVARKRESVKTGGGPTPPELKNGEEKIIVISDDVLVGIPGGVDTLEDVSGCIEEVNGEGTTDEPHMFICSQVLDQDSEVQLRIKEHKEDFKGQMQKLSNTIQDSRVKKGNKSGTTSDSQVKKGNKGGTTSDSQVKKGNKSGTISEHGTFTKRLLEIEEEKLSIKRERLQVEKKKVELLAELVSLKKTVYIVIDDCL